MRSLSPEEAALWAQVTATISPLSREKVAIKQAEEPPNPSAPETPKRVAQVRKPRVVERPKPSIGTTLDASWDRRLRSGTVAPDRILDLHGHNLDSAWHAIDRGLDDAIARGDRLILLITGHHRTGEPPIQRGKIRAAVHDWLAASRHAARIAAVRGAHRRHGGGGSLYIVLRRR